MKKSKELNQQIRNVAVDKNGSPTIDIDERKSIYKSISEALKAIPITNRNVGLTISIYNGTKVIEYWWEKGIKDSDLVEKINTDDIPRINAKLEDLQNQIDEIDNIEFKVFDSLPELGNSSIIYVIPNTTTQEDDDFIEYFWIKSQQRYQRFGGLNVDGGVTINNLYAFDNNVFDTSEEFNINKISLNDKKISIGNNGINIYKSNIGENDNELQVNIGRTLVNMDNISYGGGRVLLHGYYNQTGYDSKIYTTSLNYNTIDVNYEEGSMSYRSTLTPTSLRITDNYAKEITISKDGINYEANSEIIFEVRDNSINLNAPTTKTKKVLFRQNSATDIYLEAYHETDDDIIYHGLKSESSIYIKDSNNYFVKSQNDYSLTSYGLNGIKHRDSNTSTDLGYNILNIVDGGILTLGTSGELTINNNAILLQQDSAQLGAHLLIDKVNDEISLQKGNNANRFIKIDTNNHIKLKNGVSEINILYDEIQLKNNDGSFIIDTDGWCIMKGSETSKIGLVGTNNEQSYFVIEEGNYTLPNIKIHQNLSNYIYLYKNDEDENHINIKSEYFNFINTSNKSIFGIDSNDDVLFNPGNQFTISTGNNGYEFILNYLDGIILGKSNKININNNSIQFILGSKTITINDVGIGDGTNAKTWSQLLS